MTLKEIFNKGEAFKNWLEILAILIAAPWAVYVFYFQNVWMPAKEPPYLVISSQHSIDGEKGNFWIVRTQVKIKNLGKMRTRVLGASFNVVAFEADTSGFYDPGYTAQIKSSVPGYPTFPRYYQGKSLTVNVGRLIDPYWKMDPQEEYTRSFITLVPKKDYDLVRFYAELYACRETTDSLDVQWQVDSSGMIDLQPRRNHRLLTAAKDQALIDQTGLQRFVDLEEFSCTQTENTSLKMK